MINQSTTYVIGVTFLWKHVLWAIPVFFPLTHTWGSARCPFYFMSAGATIHLAAVARTAEITRVKLSCVQRTPSSNPSPLSDINITFLVLWLGKKKNGSIWQVNDSALNLSQRSPGIQQVCTMVTYLSLASPGLWGTLSVHKTGLRNFCWVNGEKKSSTAP